MGAHMTKRYSQEDVEELREGLEDVCRKLKTEYDRVWPEAPIDECWAECEAQWEVLGHIPTALGPYGLDGEPLE